VNAATDLAALARFWNVPVGKLAAAAVRGLSGMLSLGDEADDDDEEPDDEDYGLEDDEADDDELCPDCGEPFEACECDDDDDDD
jgi:hypothetical protein